MENRYAVFIAKSRKARVILAVFGFAFLGVLGLLWSRQRTLYSTQSPVVRNEAERQRLEELQKDDDADGLKNWEEAIFRTDPRDPDTDKDGARDGDEVAQGRDPLVAGPNDLIARERSPDKQESRADAQTNLTALLAQKFGERIIVPQLANPGAVPDVDAAAFQITNELLAREQGAVQSLKERDIVVSSDNSAKNIEQYVQTLRALTQEAFADFDESEEITIFTAAMQENDFSEFARLDASIRAHGALVEKLKKVKVPSEFTEIHLAYLNTLRQQEDAVRRMRLAEDDILGAIVGASSYAENAQTFARLQEQLFQELNKKGLSLGD